MKKITILIACILVVQLLTGALTAGAAPATAGPCQNCGSVDYYNPGPGYYPGQAYGASYAPACTPSAGSCSVYYLYTHCTYLLLQPYAPWPFWWMYPPLPGGCQP